MIPRYEEKLISRIWTDKARFEYYLQVELAILKSLETAPSKNYVIPQGTAEFIRTQAVINPQRVEEIEKTTKHDMIAFCTSITENLSPEIAKYFHFGVTSSDIIDTALSLQIKASLEVIFPAFEELLKTLYVRALEMKDVITMGRSHGMYAEPFSFGQKILGHYSEFFRRYRELKDFYEHDLTAQFSGAVGNYTVLNPKAEALAASELKLKVEPLSTQIIPRDRIAKLICLNALTAGALERLVVELRHLHHSDIGELQEGRSKGQKGSSIMPHKKNPISGENLTGMARLLRSHCLVALENIVLWHERDISHSSTERLYLPDHLGLFCYTLKRLKTTVENVVFYKDVIESKVYRSSDYLSSYYLHYLITNSTLRRDELYPLVQKAAFQTGHSLQSEGQSLSFHKNMKKILQEHNISLEIDSLESNDIKNIYLGDVDDVFSRIQAEYPLPT